jgi:hypothetical protein
VRIAVTGSTGLIGTALVAALRDGGHRVIRLVRRTPASQDEIAWDPLAPTGGLALGGVSSDILASARVMPRRLEAAGYRFRFPDLPAALAAELAAHPAPS